MAAGGQRIDSRATPWSSRRWLVLAGLCLTYASTNGILIHTLPLVYPELIDAFGWSPSEVTLPATVLYIVGALTSPPAGVLLDRLSSRKVIAAGLIGIAAGLVAFSLVTGLGQLVAVFAVFAVSLSMCGLVSNMLILSRWFPDLTGRATGILLMASSAGGAVFPLVVGWGLGTLGWRGSMQLLAAVIVVAALVPFLLLVRNRPDDAPRQTAADRAPATRGPSLAEALRSRSFYLLALATAAVWFSIIAMTQHQAIYLSGDVGIDRQLLPGLFSTFFVCSIAGKLAFGAASDRIDRHLMMQLSLLLLVAGLVLLRNVRVGDALVLYGYAVVAGIGFSGAFTMIQVLFASHFAGSSFGTILAILMMVDTLAGAAGTRVVGRLRELSGSYTGAIDLMIALLVVAAVCLVLLRPAAARIVAREQPGGGEP